MITNLPSSLKSINPSTLDILGDIPVTPIADIKKIVNDSWWAFVAWHSTSLDTRLDYLAQFQRLVLKEKDEIARLISQEAGKPLVESYFAEIAAVLNMCTWLAKDGKEIISKKEIALSNPLLFGKKHCLQFEPLGPIGIISPWNFPFSIPVTSMLMALFVGNTVILKPSEKTPLIGLKIGELFHQAGFTDRVVQVISGNGQIGQELVSNKLGRLIFTGSVATGVKIMQSAAPNLTPLTLELGGKDAAIVLPDAPIERTARALCWGAFTNAGQACASVERLYLVRGKNNEALINRIVELAKQLNVGDPLLEETEVGPLIDVEQYDNVVNQVEQAIRLGAKILCGGAKLINMSSNLKEKGLSGYFYQPTVLTDVNHDMKIMQEETFGPTLPIMIVDSVHEAIEFANDSNFALTASVWSANMRKAKEIADQLVAGTVYINDCLYSHALAQLPWGGLKRSGFGKSHSGFGLLDLVNIKDIAADTTPWLHRLWWYPYGRSKVKAARAGLDFLYGRSVLSLKKLSSLFEFITNVFRA